MKKDWLKNLDNGLPKADLVILLDVTQSDSFKRQKTNRDKFEKNKDFMNKISQAYKKIAKEEKWKIIDASQSKQDVHQQIMKLFSKKIGI